MRAKISSREKDGLSNFFPAKKINLISEKNHDRLALLSNCKGATFIFVSQDPTPPISPTIEHQLSPEMPSKGKLNQALERVKGVDHYLVKQKKLRKAAEKKKRTKETEEAGSDSEQDEKEEVNGSANANELVDVEAEEDSEEESEEDEEEGGVPVCQLLYTLSDKAD